MRWPPELIISQKDMGDISLSEEPYLTGGPMCPPGFLYDYSEYVNYFFTTLNIGYIIIYKV